MLIVSVTAAATAASILLYIGSIANALSHNDVLQNKVERFLAKTNGGEAAEHPHPRLRQAGERTEEDPGRSDTTMLLRLDPDSDAIALMSIPRDLKVEIPGYGTEKFNAAYTYGGPKLTLQVVKELTGLQINHVVNVDFLGFVRAVYAIGCVYVDVDRRYYHSNIGVQASEQYSEINVQPGYQLMCGKRALRVRPLPPHRHRPRPRGPPAGLHQRRAPAGADQGPGARPNELIDIFTEYTTSDISDTETMLEVLKLFVASRNAAIKEVHFPAELGPSYVYASPSAIARSRRPVPRHRSERRPARLARRAGRGHEEAGRRARRRSSSRW